jgi:AbrB family looped-hinge helix DNA binding protein
MAREIVSTLTSKGQITIPIEIRRQLGLETGSKLAFMVEEDGTVRVKPATYPTIESLRGIAGCMRTPMSWEEVEDVVEEERAVEIARKLQ